MKQNIVIIGGGIAGMEAAKQLLDLGYNPIIVEKADKLGGHVASWHRLFPDMAPAEELISELTGTITAQSNIFLKTEVTYINTFRNGYNVMLSNGISISTMAILVATGFSLFDAHRKEEYGYGIYDRVRADDLNSIGFVHCVGSRDVKAGNSQCSKVCCITAIKQAIEMKQKFPQAQIYCFYMDLRMFGKKYEDFYINGQKDFGVHFIRGRVSEVSENIDGKVIVKAEDTLSGKPIKVTLDLLVLMAGIVCNKESGKIASMASLPVDSDGFLKSRDNILNVVESPKPGIFYAGACTGPKTIPESVAEARAASLAIHNYVRTRIEQ